MDLKNLNVNEIKNLHEYHNVFGNFNFFESNNLLANEDTSFPNADVDHCNRTQINNYLALVNKLFDTQDYITFEISAQLQILDMMLDSLEPVLADLFKEVKANEYEPSGRSDVDGEAQRDYSAALQRYNLVADIKMEISKLYTKLSDKLEELMDMGPNRNRK